MGRKLDFNMTSFAFTLTGIAAAQRAIQAGEVTLDKAGRKRYRDAESTHGLHVIVTANSATFYRIARRPGSETKVFTRIGPAGDVSVVEARAAATALAGGDASAGRPVKVPTGGPTLGHAWEGYCEDSLARKFKVGARFAGVNTIATYRQTWAAHIERRWAAKPIARFAHDLPAFLQSLIPKPVICNRAGQLSVNLFSYAIHRKWWHERNPAIDSATRRQIFKQPVKSRTRYLSDDEAAALFAALAKQPPHWRDYFMLLLFTGARKRNVAHASWKEFRLAEGVWAIPVSKTGEPLLLPLSVDAVELLQARKANQSPKSPLVFPSPRDPRKPIGDEWHTWDAIREEAMLPDVRVHDLRRTVGSWAASAGKSVLAIQKLLGLRSISAAAVYARTDLSLSRDATDAVSARLRAARGNQ